MGRENYCIACIRLCKS